MSSQPTHATNKSAQSYDERFPDANAGFATDDGMAKVFGKYDCEICGRKTEWVHSKLTVYLCSRDCLTRYEQQQGGIIDD